MNTCNTCKFWNEHTRPEAKGSGFCRRFPPQITTRVYTLGTNENAGRYEPETESSIEMEWPETKAAEWCGEHVMANNSGQK